MDIHHRAVGILHIVEAAFFMMMLLIVTLFFGVIAAFANIDPAIIALVTGIGSILFLPFLLLAIGQIIAAIALLRGSENAQIWVMIFGALSLLNFPFGTALGIYTFWALLREKPPTSS
jgi:hypothetical protein